jgi:hypothetical protein
MHRDETHSSGSPPAFAGRRRRRALLAGLISTLAVARLTAVTLPELQHDARLTPHRFANYFDEFDFEYHVEVEPAEMFLAERKGDCDDYAILADFVLNPKGFATRLIHIRLASGDAHAVCYVGRDHVYLDYNNRSFFINTTKCGATIREIANKVADSLQASWTSASEYTYSYITDRKIMIATVVRTDPPEKDPVPGAPPPRDLHVD